METTSQNPDSRSEASSRAGRCPFCGPTMERGPDTKCCAGMIPSPYSRGLVEYGCTRLPGHSGPCVACAGEAGGHGIAVSDTDAA